MIDSRPVPRIRILSVAMTTATGQPPELHRPLPAELLVTDAAHRLAKIAAARAPALGATDAWGMTYLFVKSSSCTSLLDRSLGHNSDPPTAPGVRHAVAAIFLQVLAMTTAATMVNDSTMDIWSPRWPPTRWCSLHSTRSMAELSVVRQIDEHFEANGHGYPRPTRDQTDAPAPSPTPARVTGSASHEGRSASGSRSSPDAASLVLILFCVLVSGRRRRRGSLPGARPGV